MRSETNTGFTQNQGPQDAEGQQEKFNKLIEAVQTFDENASEARQPADSSPQSEPPGSTSLGQKIEADASSIEFATREQIGRLILELANGSSLFDDAEFVVSLDPLFLHLARRIKKTPDSFDDGWLNETAIATVYRQIPSESNARGQLLAALASMNSEDALGQFAQLIADDPPADERGVLIGFSPLVSGEKTFRLDLLFPKLLEALRYKHIAAIVLDFSNYATRKGLTSVHPAKPRVQQLTVLLGQVVNQLALIEEGKINGKSAQEISQSVNESVALTVSLCDSLALCEHFEAIGKVRQAMALKHRRVKTEAAAALIRLGDTEEQQGRQQLVELASEPICRLRVLEYAKENDLLEQIDPKYQNAAARAESQLALWLAAAGQMGVAPTTLELIHQCRLRWPGFDDFVECFLFRFEYRFAGQTYSNVGIVGPLTHAFACNLEHLATGEMLAAFAGWQTEHEDIYTVDFEKARAAMPGLAESLLRRLASEFDHAEEAFLGFFFETPVLIARVSDPDSDELPFVVAIDRDHVLPIPSGSLHSPVTPEIAFEIYKGFQLLNAFNDPEAFEDCRGRKTDP